MNKLRTAQILAQELLAEAVENEPNITADLQIITREISAEIIGLEDKFKTEKSLIKKLIDKADFNLESVREIAENINDVLRYTFVLQFDDYTKKFRQTIEELENLDYQIPQNRIWNAWQTAEKRFDRGYRGINITVISSQNQTFELQFHTEESFGLKSKTHFLYKKLSDGKISRERKSEIIKKLKAMAKSVKRPRGI